jgi:uncharacterized protein YkwD
MKLLSLSVLATIASQVAAKTVYVTSTTIITVEVLPTNQAPPPKPVIVEQKGSIKNTPPVDDDDSEPTTLTQVAAVVTTGTPAPAKPAPATTTQSTKAAATTTQSTKASATTSSTGDAFADEMLAAHNGYRSLHHSPNLEWSSTLQQYAQNYADNFNCASGDLKHSGGPYGENLYLGATSGKDAVDGWYDESKTYDWNTQTTYDHFTAMIWKSTTKLGCGIKDCRADNWGYYVICSYNDAVPNMLGEAKQNVLPI